MSGAVIHDADRPAAPPVIVALSGQIGTGKTTLSEALEDAYGVTHVRTQELMRDAAATRGEALAADRRALQEYGEQLDRDTYGRWVADAIAQLLAGSQDNIDTLIVDAVRTLDQIEALRDAFPSRVIHIHLEAPAQTLEHRYDERRATSQIDELASYAEAAANTTEAATALLLDQADISINTQRSAPADVLARSAAALGLKAPRNLRCVDVMVGGQYGSEGKGNIAYHLAAEYDLLVRVGGPNAGHKVPTNPVYTHRLLPSGTLANPRAQLLIGPGATLDLEVLMAEISACRVEVGRLFIDPQAMMISQEDKERERAMVAGIGSTGKGGGAAAARKILGRTAESGTVSLARDVPELQPYLRPASKVLDDAYRRGWRVLLEGTQGTALSLHHGLYPYVTSRDTTTAGCLAEAGIGVHRVRRVIMVVRTYPIRVGSPPDGTSGWMSQPIDWATIADRARLDGEELAQLERGSVSGTQRRVAEFDWTLLDRAAELNGATDIALTFADYLDAGNKDARRYDQLSPETIHFVEEVERVAGAKVSLIATGFSKRSVIDRREW